MSAVQGQTGKNASQNSSAAREGRAQGVTWADFHAAALHAAAAQVIFISMYAHGHVVSSCTPFHAFMYCRLFMYHCSAAPLFSSPCRHVRSPCS